MPSSRDIWEPRKVWEARYRNSLYDLIDFFLENLSGRDLSRPETVLELFQQYAASDAFASYVNIMASRMVTGLAVENQKTWREAARKSMRGQRIFEGLRREMQGPVGETVRRLVVENAKLISTFPERISVQVANFIQKESMKGNRAKTITDDLVTRFPRIARGRLNLIARTETAKAQTAIVQARAEEVDLAWYCWRSSKDARVRFSHRKMDGVLCSWSDPPNPELLFPAKNEKATFGNYPPGGCPNCRCFGSVLVDLNQVQWPHRVFRNGAVVNMSRTKFEQISGLNKAA